MNNRIFKYLSWILIFSGIIYYGFGFETGCSCIPASYGIYKGISQLRLQLEEEKRRTGRYPEFEDIQKRFSIKLNKFKEYPGEEGIYYDSADNGKSYVLRGLVEGAYVIYRIPIPFLKGLEEVY